MSYQDELRVVLNRYPEIESIEIVCKESIKRNVMPAAGIPVVKEMPMNKPKIKKNDLFEIEEVVKEFPKTKVKPAHLDDKAQNVLASTMAALNNPPQVDI